MPRDGLEEASLGTTAGTEGRLELPMFDDAPGFDRTALLADCTSRDDERSLLLATAPLEAAADSVPADAPSREAEALDAIEEAASPLEATADAEPEGVLGRGAEDPGAIEGGGIGVLAARTGIVEPLITLLPPATAIVVPPTTVLPGATPSKGTADAELFPAGASMVVPPMTLLPPGTATV